MKTLRQLASRSITWPMVGRAVGLVAVVSVGVLTIIASDGGGGSGCVDVYPTPAFDFMAHRGIDAADMNADGLNDLVFSGALIYGSEPEAQRCGGTARSDGKITVLLQDLSSPGTFLPPRRYAVSSGAPNAVKLADLNADALPDVIATDRYGSSTFRVWLNDPMNAGQLGDGDAYSTVAEPHLTGVGDIDLDGQVDLAIAGSTRVAWHRQTGNGRFGARNVIGVGDNAVALLDFDADGLLDVATCNNDDIGDIDDDDHDDILIYQQSLNAPGSFRLSQDIFIDASIGTLAAGDLNEDGRPDIAAVGFGLDGYTPQPGWYRVLQIPRARLEFSLDPFRFEASNNSAAAPIVTDLDGDQREDVVIGGMEAVVTVFLQDVLPVGFSRKTVYALPAGEVFHTRDVDGVAVADLNGDMLPDIAVSNGEVFVMFQKQSAPGTFGPPVLVAGWEP